MVKEMIRPETGKTKGEMRMRAKVDPLQCRTVGECVKLCPEVFRFQEGSKKATVTLDPIPPGLEEKVCEAARRCPQKAVLIEK
jgi:ferredoxin